MDFDDMDLDLFGVFYVYNSELFGKYDAAMLRRVFDALLDRIDSTDGNYIPLADLEKAVAGDLAADNIHCIGLAKMIGEMMPFICEWEGLAVSTMAMHRDAVHRLAWSVLARHVEEPARYSGRLADAIIKEFEKSGDVSTADAFASITAMNGFSAIPDEAIEETISASFDYFVNNGMIGTC